MTVNDRRERAWGGVKWFSRRPLRPWLIRRRHDGAWWRADAKGYADSLARAGFYTEAEARAQFRETWPKGDDHSEPVSAIDMLNQIDAEAAKLGGEAGRLRDQWKRLWKQVRGRSAR